VSSRQCLVTVGEFEPGTTIEAELVRAGQAGDPAALEQLLRLHQRALFTLCRGILGHAEDAEDAVQETHLRALRALPGFRPGRAAFRTWLFRIAVNVSLNWKRDRRAADPWDEDHAAAASLTASAEAIALRRLQVREALSELPPRHRALIVLKLVEGWSVAEIAAAMGWSPIRVKNELAKARRTLAEWQLRNALEGEEP
jgi:RNA polymerase sigma-70 factor (ECF subfamily)